jgi:hypothetical protein
MSTMAVESPAGLYLDFSFEISSSGRADIVVVCARDGGSSSGWLRSDDSCTVGFLSDSSYERLSAPTPTPASFILHKHCTRRSPMLLQVGECGGDVGTAVLRHLL